MKHTLGLFVNPKHQQILYGLALVTVFAFSLALFTASYFSNSYLAMSGYTDLSRQSLAGPTKAAIRGFDGLESLAQGALCDERTVGRLRDASFVPDGINEFMYAPDDIVLCTSSTGQLPVQVALGKPHIAASNASPLEFWFGVDLRAFGHRGEYGTILKRGRFAVVLPKVDPDLGRPPWLTLEGVYWAGRGIAFHANGKPGAFTAHLNEGLGGWSVSDAVLTRNLCDAQTRTCVSAVVSLGALLWHSIGWLSLALAFSALLAGFAAGRLRAFLLRYFAFEARLLCNLTEERLVCHYQAILDTATREISRCEVLSRWRDIDGSIVYPDHFIPVLERHGRMMEFTRMVVKKAWEELCESVPNARALQVNFNISPQDFTNPATPELFARFLEVPNRFTVAVEIVESERIVLAEAERIIAALREKGIKTYIDDFGSGYSNLDILAHLSADAVKLDKSFAMAPENSLMAEMLDFAIQMANAIGRSVVVEGVETAERMDHLLNGRCPVQYLQGYFVSRPVDVQSFVALLLQGVPSADRQRDVQRYA